MNALNDFLNLTVIAFTALAVGYVAPGLWAQVPDDVKKPEFAVCGIAFGLALVWAVKELVNFNSSRV